MKKYQQLLLAIISVVSFFCLLIYRHEYNKLRYVLEVLNFFGTPGGSTPVPLLCDPVSIIKSGVTPIEPIPAWQRVSNSLYIYSAYWDEADDKERVVALAVGVLNENLNYGCYIYYNAEPKTKMGQFSFSDLLYNKNSGKSKTKGFVFYCKAANKGATPVGVLFFKTSANDSSQGFLPVHNLQSNHLPPTNSIGICVMPAQFPNLNRSTYLEFLAFHEIVGVNNFIIYGGNDQYNLLSSVQKSPFSKMNLTVMQWNYPFFRDTELEKIIAENDCKIRTRGLFENVLVLEWNKFFVPHYLFSISNILNELDPSKKTFKFQFLTLLFCNEYEDDPKSDTSTPHVFRKTRYAFPKINIFVPIYRPYMKTGQVQKVSKDIVSVQQYASCRDFKIKSGEKKVAKIDTSIFKFRNELLNSQILRL